MSTDNDVPRIIVFETKDDVPRPWLGMFLQNGKYLPVYFRADSKLEVMEKAKVFWLEMRAKYRKDGVVTEKKTEEKTEKPTTNGGKRGHHFAGTAWVIHPKTKQAARIPSAEIDAYLKNGYVRGKTLKA